jgi:hypothetical protein
MTIDELISSGIRNLSEFEHLVSRKQRLNIVYLPEKISEVVSDIAHLYNPSNAIVLTSNLGEITLKLKDIKNIISIEKNKNISEISQYLNPHLKVLNEDPLNFSSTSKFDVVITFPPLGQKLEIDGRILYGEIPYVEKALKILNQNGAAILVLSNSFLSSPMFANIRNLILSEYGIAKIISIPSGVIKSTGIELSIIVVKKKIEKTEFYEFNSELDLKSTRPFFVTNKEQLSDRWDFNFHNPKNQKYKQHLIEKETSTIGDLVEIHFGIPYKTEDKKERGKYKLLFPKNIINGFIEEFPDDYFFYKEFYNEREKNAIVKKGDILFPRLNRANVPIYVHNSDDEKYIATPNLVILRGKNAEYVSTYLNTESGLNIFNQQIKRHARGALIPTISRQDLSKIQIPILPISDLEYASKNHLEKLSYDELVVIKNKYDELKLKYANLKNDLADSPHAQQLYSLQNTLQQVLLNQKEHSQQLHRIENKIDDIKTVIFNLSNDFKEIQDLPRDIEEKIKRLNKKLEEQISNLHFEQKQIDSYITEIKNWFDYYELLEEKSQKYLPEAEYIFDHISKLDNPDYSPFILQYCRALENELLSKIFRAYVQSLIDCNIEFETTFAWDLGKKDSGKPNNDNTFKLSKHIQKCLTKNREDWFFELGSMEVNLRYLTGSTIEKSPLLQHLKEFVLVHFKKELLNIEYLDDIKTIIREYRNQSAHPNLMDTEKAISFHKQMKECLINLMENYKNKQ